MNKLFIIGNGFDLAHGLDTRYSDFLLWYLKDVLNELSFNQHFSDDLIELNYKGQLKDFKINKIRDFIQMQRPYLVNGVVHNPVLNVKYKSGFFKDIIETQIDYKWVDIECLYYKHLLELYKKSADRLQSKIHTNRENVISLNECLNSIKCKLVKYLKSLDTAQPNAELHSILREEISKTYNNAKSNTKPYHEIQFLVFNYTSTVEIYNCTDIVPSANVTYNYIHGKLTDTEKPIIFGYGDETDDHYSKIESLNVNEYLDNIKSFNYLKTGNYRNLARFVDSDEYVVCIMGHSCGLSDRVLLKSIFEHINCQSIRIYYHLRKDKSDDFFEKTQEISRHFNSNLKDSMRRKIVPFDRCFPLIKSSGSF